jgi:predicted NBD/HSP70 family sugar kinase
MKEARGVYAEQQPPGWTSDMTIDNLFELANEGEEYAVKVVQQAGRFLGIGLVNLINTHNPERIILGDEMTRAGKVWFDAVISTVKAQTLPEVLKGTDIQVSDLAIEPAFLGTGVLVVSKSFERVSAL